jgi:hypothetical protein
MATTNYSWNLPTVGGSEDTWGTQLNANWTAIDTLLGGVTNTEFQILDGATVTTAELNILDGVTATTAEINKLDGVTWNFTSYNTLTASASELNILDGATVTTTELNYLDGVTSNIQTQINNITTGGGANDSTITITAGNALTGGGAFTLNQSFNEAITLNHADTSSVSNLTASGRYISAMSFDAYGHVTSYTAPTFPVPDELSTASGSAPSYSARVWVNFIGTGTPTFRDQGNVSSITDNGTGDYTVNFSTALIDDDYSVVSGILDSGSGNVNPWHQSYGTLSTTSVRVYTSVHQGSSNTVTRVDLDTVTLAIFR